VEFACERGREIETEAVHVHLFHPETERIHDELEHVRIAHVQAVSGARVVHVAALVGREPVVRGVVQAAETHRGPRVVPLTRVVVHDVQDHLDAGLVQCLHHLLELEDLFARISRARILGRAAQNSLWSCSPSSS